MGGKNHFSVSGQTPCEYSTMKRRKGRSLVPMILYGRRDSVELFPISASSLPQESNWQWSAHACTDKPCYSTVRPQLNWPASRWLANTNLLELLMSSRLEQHVAVVMGETGEWSIRSSWMSLGPLGTQEAPSAACLLSTSQSWTYRLHGWLWGQWVAGFNWIWAGKKQKRQSDLLFFIFELRSLGFALFLSSICRIRHSSFKSICRDYYRFVCTATPVMKRELLITLSLLCGTASQSTPLNHRCFFTSSAPFCDDIDYCNHSYHCNSPTHLHHTQPHIQKGSILLHSISPSVTGLPLES